ncbi:MAG TPA: hypothetical protein VMV00_01440 [Candidatus Baltobacteraceae bacterium]|nr:hypothetical protein [Candidatus Baltobacteraceae bacterium]
MSEKSRMVMRVLPIAAVLAILLVPFMSMTASAQSTSSQPANPVYSIAYFTCAGTNGHGGIVDPSRSILNVNNSSAQSLLSISLVIMLMFALLTGAVYGIGYAFKFDRLVRFAKTELNEVIITIIVVFLFVGTFAVGTSAIGPSSHLFAVAGQSFNNNVFVSDCSLLYFYGYQIFTSVIATNSFQKVLGFFFFSSISIMPNQFGISFQPFLGLQTASSVINFLNLFLGAFFMVMVAAAVLIGLIYSIFPLFLYVGIALRTIPWTRAAGGSFLGVFLGFYIIFPLLLYSMLGAYTTSFPSICPQANDVNTLSSLNSLVSGQSAPTFDPTAVVGTFLNLIQTELASAWTISSQGMLTYLGECGIEPFAYGGFALVISFIISFDFIEAAGNILGAPSLSGEGVLKKII